MSLYITLTATRPQIIFSYNITHDLGVMAAESGLYECMWHPEKPDVETDADLIPFLELGLERLKSDPNHYESFNLSNGWRSYEGLVKAVTKYLAACKENPDAIIYVSR